MGSRKNSMHNSGNNRNLSNNRKKTPKNMFQSKQTSPNNIQNK